MNKTLFYIISLTTLVMSGCTIPDAKISPAEPQRKEIQQAPVKITQVASSSFSITGNVDSKLRIKFSVPASEASFCNKLITKLQESAIPQNAEIVEDNRYDILVKIIPDFEEKDKDGNYFRIICNEIIISIHGFNKTLGIKSIEPVALQRALGLSNAKNQYVKPIAREAIPFISQKLENISNTKLGITEITFKLANTAKEDISFRIAKEIENLNSILNSQQGIVNYQNIFQDSINGICTFRIVYVKENYPQGLINALNLELKKSK